jgi:2-hydroxychromene-2-carboxylate isomerase
MINPNQQSLITHVPSQRELEDLQTLNREHDPNHALRPEEVHVIFKAMGLDVPATNTASLRSAHEPRYTAVTELPAPFIEPASERTVHGDDLRKLHEQAQQILGEEQQHQ